MQNETRDGQKGPQPSEPSADPEQAQADDLELGADEGAEVTGGAKGLAVGKGIRIRSN